MSPILRHITRFCCLLLVFQVFILTAHADEVDEDEFAIEQGITVIHQQGLSTELNQLLYQHKQEQTHMWPEHHHSKKFQTNKNIPVPAFFVKHGIVLPYSASESTVHTPSVPKKYRYIFFREINPPPPKAC